MEDLVAHRLAGRVAAVAEIVPAGPSLELAQLGRPGGQQGAAEGAQIVVGVDPDVDRDI